MLVRRPVSVDLRDYTGRLMAREQATFGAGAGRRTLIEMTPSRPVEDLPWELLPIEVRLAPSREAALAAAAVDSYLELKTTLLITQIIWPPDES